MIGVFIKKVNLDIDTDIHRRNIIIKKVNLDIDTGVHRRKSINEDGYMMKEAEIRLMKLQIKEC